MKAIHALLLLGIAGYAMAMTTDSMVTMGPGGMPGDSGGMAPPQLPGGLQVSAGGINMRDMKALDPASLRSSVANMSQSEQDTVCQGAMNGGADSGTMANLAAAGVDCFGAMTRDASFRPDPAQAHQTLALKRESSPPSNWGQSDWSTAIKQMPDAVTASDLRQMSSATMISLVQAGDLQGSTAFQDPSKQRALETQLKSAYGQPNTWTNSSLRQMGSLLGDMDKTTLKSIPADQMKAAASSFRDLSFDDPGKKAAIGNQLIEGLGKNNAGSWTSEDVVNADQFIRNNPAIISQLSDSSLLSSVSDLGARSTDKRGAAQLGKRLKSMSSFSDPTAVNSSSVAQMGHLMQGMGRDYLSKLPADAISGAISTLANVSFPRGDARELMAKVKGNLSSYDSAKIKEMGHLMTGLDPVDLDSIPASAFADSLDDIKDKDFDVGQCRAIVAKVKSAGASNVKKMGSLASKCMTPDDFDSISVDDLGLNCADSTAPTFTPDKATAKKLFAKIKARFGAVGASNTNYTLTCMKNWGRVAALGMDPMDFENLPDNGDLGSIFEQLANEEADMDDSQTKAIAMRARTFLNMDNDTAVMAHDSAVIEQVGKFMKHFNDSDMNKFNSSVKPDIAQKLGEANLDELPQADITRMKTFALQNVLRDDTGAVTDRTGAATLDDNDIRDMGNLFRGVESADVNKMSGDAISANINNMQDQVRGLTSQKAIVDRMDSQDGTFFDSSDNVISSAGLVGGMDSTRVAAMNSTVLGESLSDAATQMEARDSMDQMRDMAGFSNEVSSADSTSMENNKAAFVQKAFDGYQTSQNTGGSSRRRRQTTTITCSDVQVLGSNAVTLTSAQIETLTATEFTDCTETLGAITGWSSTQLASLATVAKTAYGSTVSSWSSANVQLIGTMLAGLTDAEIGSLAISSASVLSVAGTSSMFSSAQMAAAFGQFLTTAKSGSASAVTGSELMSLGSFVCGPTTSQIASFTSANYMTAASTIGAQTVCSSSQLEAYAALAKAGYGATSTWDSATVTTIGNVIGGLTASEITALTSTQISYISTTSIAAMPTTKFSSFSSTQLSGFTSAQANAVTADQQNALSATQLASLVGAGATNLTTQSSAGSIRASILLVIPLMALFL